MKTNRWALQKTLPRKGFTLVELAVVIVVIALLAAMTVVSYINVQNNARAMAMIADFKHIDEAMRLYSQKHGLEAWPVDTSPLLTGTSDPNVASIIANPATDFKQYLGSIDAVKSSGVSGLAYLYDMDNDTYTGCSATMLAGVNILVQGKTPKVIAQYIDDAIDDGNLSCGSVTYVTSTQALRVNLSKTPAF